MACFLIIIVTIIIIIIYYKLDMFKLARYNIHAIKDTLINKAKVA